MKPTILAIMAVLTFSVVQAAPTVLAPEELKQVCAAKWNLTKHLLNTRTERSMNEAMEVVDDTWDEVLSDLPHFEHVTLVDMRRITQDVYRRYANGNYRLKVSSEQDVTNIATHELRKCHYQGF